MINIKGLENINESLSAHYLIYKIINNINGKYYIGQHVTEDPEDLYFGSGRLIRKALNKYNLSCFTKEILFDYDNFEDMNNKEIELVQLSNCWPYDKMSYNLKLGGSNGSLTEYERIKIGKSQKERLSNLTQEKRDSWIKKLSEVHSGKNNPMYRDFEHTKGFRTENDRRKGKTLEEIWGKSRAKEIKLKISKSTVGENNGCYGKRWLHNSITKDKVYVFEYEIQKYKEIGYIEGTGIATSKNHKWINNGIKEMQVFPDKVDEYLKRGWTMGKMKTTRKMINPITGKYKYVKPQDFQKYLNNGFIFGTGRNKENYAHDAVSKALN